MTHTVPANLPGGVVVVVVVVVGVGGVGTRRFFTYLYVMFQLHRHAIAGFFRRVKVKCQTWCTGPLDSQTRPSPIIYG